MIRLYSIFYIFDCFLISYFAQGHVPVKQPVFKTQPTTIKCEENETVFVPCLIDDLGGSYVRWWKNGSLVYDTNNPLISVPPRYTVLQDGLSIQGVQAEDGGEFSCEVVRPEPWSPLKLVHTVQVMYPPTIYSNPPEGLLEVVLGEKVRIGCSATGVPPPRITWRVKDMSMGVLGENLETLEFMASSRLLSGLYQCEASNGVGSPVQSTVVLKVLHEPEVEADKTWVHSAPGVKTALTCRVVAEPEAKVAWFFNGGALKASAPRILQQTKGDEHLLLFHPVAASDFGNYTCRASNQLGTAESVIQLSGVANPATFKTAQSKPPDGFTLIWEVDSNSPVIEYKLLLRKGHDSRWVSVIIPADSFPSGPLHSKSYTISGLDRHTIYEAKIVSRNRFGWSDPSRIIKFGFTQPHYIEGDDNGDNGSQSSGAAATALRKIPIQIFLFVLTSFVTLFRSICDIS